MDAADSGTKPETTRGWWHRWGSVALGLALGVLVFAIYYAAPVLQSSTDARYTTLAAEHLLARGTMKLDPSFQFPLDPARYPSDSPNTLPYQVMQHDGHVYYAYPPGTVILVAPAVWVLNRLGYTAHNGEWLYEPDGDTRMQRILAPLVTVLFVLLVWAHAAGTLGAGGAAVLAAVVALGTMAFSTASRGLWSDTWGIVLLQAAVLLAAGDTGRRTPARGVALGSALAWLVLVRPTYVVAVAVVVGWLWVYRRDLVVWCVGAGLAWAAAFGLFLYVQTGSPLPMYSKYGGMVTWRAIPAALPGHLFSPSRGLLTLVPVLWFVVWVAVRHRAVWRDPLWHLAMAGLAAHLMLISCWPIWWAGHSFGPRLTIGALPFMALAGVVAVRFWWPHRGAVSAVALGVLSALSIAIHTTGSFSFAAWQWNSRPETVHATPEDMWDWRYPQVLAGVLTMPLPRTFPDLPPDGVVAPGEATAGRVLVRGWSGGENHWRWSSAAVATAVFRHPAGGTLHVHMHPYLGGGRITAQRVAIHINGVEAWAGALDSLWSPPVAIPLPPSPDGRYRVDFHLPDAASPATIGDGNDQRQLGIRLEGFGVQ